MGGSKAEYVSGLVEERKALLARVAEIDAEIERSWRAGGAASVNGASKPAVSPSAGHTGNVSKMLDMIVRTPTLDYETAAMALYGEVNSVTRRRVRKLLSYLASHGRIESTGKPREWKVLKTKA